MKSDKCRIIISSNDENKKAEFDGEVINNTQIKKRLGLYIDHKLGSDTHIENSVQKGGKKKFHGLARVKK